VTCLTRITHVVSVDPVSRHVGLNVRGALGRVHGANLTADDVWSRVVVLGEEGSRGGGGVCIYDGPKLAIFVPPAATYASTRSTK